jgi:ligand-binding sensor domain-containing protein/signal transduction histidine kinase/DNA-binding response OmpR family regulator
MAKFFKIIFLLILLPTLLFAQNKNIKFEYISVEQGLSHGNVQSIVQDYQGFMWFATEDGLNKYDGYTFTTYRHDPIDSTSLSSDYLQWIYEDSERNLWISTIGGGLNKYNRDQDNFLSFKSDRDNPESIIADVMQQTVAFNYDGKEVLWIGTQFGLCKMDIMTQRFKYYPHTKRSFPYSYIDCMVVDSSGIVWIGSYGLHKFNPRTKQFTHYQHDPKDPFSLSDDNVLSMFLDRTGQLWIGTTSGGLNRFDPKTEQFIHYMHDPENPYSLSGNWIVAINEDQLGNLWIGTAVSGLNRFDRKTGQFMHYKHDSGNPTSLSDNTVMCIYQDQSGIFWVGTWEGINKFDPEQIRFSNYRSLSSELTSISENYIWSVCGSSNDEKEVLWVGTKSGGLNKLDRRTEKFTRYLHNSEDSQSIPSNKISALFEDRAGILWIGTWGAGLIKFDQAREEFNQYFINSDQEYIGINVMRTIYEDQNGILWIGTQGGGLFKFNRIKNQFSPVGYRTQIMQIYEDHLGVLWIASYSGLKQLDRVSEKYTTFWYNPADPNSISSDKVISIYEDKKGRLWFGTIGGGLNKFNRGTDKFKSYTVKNGLPNDVIQGILEDEQGYLWLSTNNGLSKFNPETESFRNYDASDGLLGNQFYPGACCKTKDGEMFFGGPKGLNSFYPDRLQDNKHIPEIVITDFQIFNRSVPVRSDNDSKNHYNYFLSKPIYLMKELILSYRENIFSFEFAALEYHGPQKNQYAYKMEGVDPDWVFTNSSRRFATYTNLDPGEYNFWVKGSNNDGIWNEEGTSIKVIITPPWWRTYWAYTFYLLLFISIVVTTWRAQLRRIKIKQQLKMEHFEAEKLREVDHLKSRFFANISHEFRTPLTLILGPVKQMLTAEFIGNLKDQYKMIIRNGERLLGLINQILDLSKLESGEMNLMVSEINIVKYLKGFVLSFVSLAERKKISLKFEYGNKEIFGYVDRDKVEKIVTNLVSNAFKFTPAGGLVEVEVLTTHLDVASSLSKKEASGIKIKVSNTGPGIPSEQLDKIFDRFYQVDDNYKKDSESTGLGLAITKEMVEICGGEISVSSIPNKTTTFIVTLPITKESFKDDEIVETVIEDFPLKKGARGLSEPVSESSELDEIKPKFKPNKTAPLLLIVEDNPDVTNYICSFMENDYQIVTAENGKIGLKITLDKYPDLIISDVMMPEMDGFELCKMLKTDERVSHIPVILLTAKADLDSRIEGLEFGADDYVTKPFEARELQIRTKNLIEQRQKLREKFSLLMDLKPEDIAASSIDEQLIQRLLNVFEEHIEKPDFSIEQLAQEIGMSRKHLNRKIQAMTNLSTSDFVRTLRLQKAAHLLKNASGTVTEIAYKVGFNNLSYFSKAFHRHFGKLPRDFMNK